jgi:hypothetical protein
MVSQATLYRSYDPQFNIKPTDAVPKKRGPKTDVLEALLKRVDGLEKRLHDEKNPISPTSPDQTPDEPLSFPSRRNTIDTSFSLYNANEPRSALSNSLSQHVEPFPRLASQSGNLLPQQPPTQGGLSEAILDIYFSRLHGKPFFILDEATTRQRHQMNQLPAFLSLAISAMALR